MATGDRQRFIAKLIGEIIDCSPDYNHKFDWLKNVPLKEDFLDRYPDILKVFESLKGDTEQLIHKSPRLLSPDVYYGGNWNFILEFDEVQHFTQFKKIALSNYPPYLKLGFDIKQYIHYCDLYRNEALKKGAAGYRMPKPEFPFENGRAAQRAFFDSFRDFLPDLHGLNPTIRIAEFEVESIITGNNSDKEKLKELLIKKGLDFKAR